MVRQFEIVIDSLMPARLARFWASALPGYSVRTYDATEIARLAELGLTAETDPSVAVDGDGPTLWFQKSEQPYVINWDSIACDNRDFLVMGNPFEVYTEEVSKFLAQPRARNAPARMED